MTIEQIRKKYGRSRIDLIASEVLGNHEMKVIAKWNQYNDCLEIDGDLRCDITVAGESYPNRITLIKKIITACEQILVYEQLETSKKTK